MDDWNFTDFAAPLPDNKDDAEFEKKQLIAEIVMIRDQIDAVSNGDATPPDSRWVFSATAYRQKLQTRCNRLNLHIKNLPARVHPQMIEDEKRRLQNIEKREAHDAQQLKITEIKEREKTRRAQIAADHTRAKYVALRDFLKSDPVMWEKAKEVIAGVSVDVEAG